MKKRGFGVGKWNGYGGKCNNGESIEQGVIREIAEEGGVIVASGDLEYYGSIKFYFPHKPEFDQQGQIFITRNWTGEPIETEEMKPRWFSFDAIPYESMWKDDPYWLPYVLAGKTIEAQFYFDEHNEGVERWEVKEV